MFKTSFTMQSAKNSLLLIVKDTEIGYAGVDYKDETVKKSPRSKNTNKATGYSTPKARLTLTN